jgi:hypothetical protein
MPSVILQCVVQLIVVVPGRYDIQHNDTQQNDTQHNHIQHYNTKIAILSTTTHSIMALYKECFAECH